jgi:RNA polymerase sigma-70 factor (ECF subfamily)
MGTLTPQSATGEAPPAANSDAMLVLAAQRDAESFSVLYGRYLDAVLRFCFYRLGDWTLAEDATSDVFIRVLTNLSTFQPVGHDAGFRCWLFTIARNVIADYHRDHTRHPADSLDAAFAVHDAAPTPEEVATTTNDHQLIRDLMAHLKPDQRELLELRLAGLKNADIGRILGRSHEAIRKEQSRIVKSLRVLVGQQAELGVPYE